MRNDTEESESEEPESPLKTDTSPAKRYEEDSDVAAQFKHDAVEQMIKIKQDLEGRMTTVENWKESMQVEMVTRLCEQVCLRINMNMMTHLPRVG